MEGLVVAGFAIIIKVLFFVASVGSSNSGGTCAAAVKATFCVIRLG